VNPNKLYHALLLTAIALGIAVIATHWPESALEWAARVLTLITLLGAYGLSFQSARDPDEQKTNRELAALLEVSRTLGSTLDIDALLKLVLGRLKPIVDYDGAAIYVLQSPDQLRLVRYEGPIPASELVRIWSLNDEPVSRQVVQSGQPIIISDVQALTDEAAEFRQSVGKLAHYIKSWMCVPLIARDQVIGTLSFDYLKPNFYTGHHVALASAFGGQVAVALENARLYRAEQERRLIAESLGDILKALNSTRDLDDVLDYLMVQAARLLDAAAVAIYKLDEETRILSVQAALGLPPDYLETMRVPLGEGVVGRAVAERQPITISNVAPVVAAYRANEDAEQKAIVSGMIRLFRSILALPLFIRERVYGGLVLYYPQQREFLPEDVALAKAFGDQAALAIETASLRMQIEKAAVDAERQRLARDLHDAVTQTLFSASVIAEVLPTLWKSDPEQAERRTLEVRRLTRGALAEMRTLLVELRPGALTEVTLSELLRQLAEAALARSSLKIDLALQGSGLLPPETQIAVYRIAQEALNNIVRHAHAQSVRLALDYSPQHADLRISDDGHGFSVDHVEGSHFGLRIMQERAEAAQAELIIDSQPGQGTKISLVWPATEES
jgi:signal transduction histidine kinase